MSDCECDRQMDYASAGPKSECEAASLTQGDTLADLLKLFGVKLREVAFAAYSYASHS